MDYSEASSALRHNHKKHRLHALETLTQIYAHILTAGAVLDCTLVHCGRPDWFTITMSQ